MTGVERGEGRGLRKVTTSLSGGNPLLSFPMEKKGREGGNLTFLCCLSTQDASKGQQKIESLGLKNSQVVVGEKKGEG